MLNARELYKDKDARKKTYVCVRNYKDTLNFKTE